jgi:hypothetical protein
MSMHRTVFWRLTRRANQRHIVIIADIRKARAIKPAAGFFTAAMLSAGKFQIIEPVSLHFR